MHKKINKYLIIPNDNKINEYNTNSFIFPLLGYSVGFERYFNVEEINKYSTLYEVSIIINKFLHKEELEKIREIIKKLKNIKYYFVEDFGLNSILPKEKIVLFPNHIISNYETINYLDTLGYKSSVVSNELTIDELMEIRKNTNGNLFYMYVNKNNIMYSKRELLTNYYDFYDIKNRNKKVKLDENVSKHNLFFYEEDRSTTVFNNKIFCASKYIDKLSEYNLIINFNNIDDNTKKIILSNINNEKLCTLIDSDYKFLEEPIMYKVGDLK